jgi:hypothetical protein
MNRRLVLQAIIAGAAGWNFTAQAATAVIDVYKSASCGCCEGWVKHLRENGFTVKSHDVQDPAAYRRKFGIPEKLGACHTGMIKAYAIEGHVPAAEIKRLLAEKPKAIGLAVPEMPLGSPGMEAPRSEPYDVLLVKADGRHVVYKHYN